MTAPRPLVVRHDGLALAVTDRGDPDGPCAVLLPGLGGRQSSLDAVAACLPGWRVVTVDPRGHGRSGTGPWSFDHAVADLHAVVTQLGLDRPLIAGHSLGGMTALRYALAGHQVAGVVNVDGWGTGTAARHLGADPALVAAHLDALAQGRLPTAPARLLSGLTRQGRQGTTAQVLRALAGADVVAWHGEAPCPSVALHAVGAGSSAGRLLGGDAVLLSRAHRAGLRRDLAALAARRPDVEVVEVNGGHLLITSHPELVAAALVGLHERTRG